MPVKYAVEMTAIAERVYRRIYDDAQECLRIEDTSNSRVKLLRIVDDALDNLIPHDPFSPDRALSGFLSNTFRIKKGRLRICYIGSSQKRRITILYISDTPRKLGDVHDPYAVFTSLVMSGKFDEAFDALGVRRPNRRK